MKYLKLPKTTLENVNREAWERKLGRPKREEDISEFLCAMCDCDGDCEIEIQDEDVQWFTPTHQAQMTDEKTVIIPDPLTLILPKD